MPSVSASTRITAPATDTEERKVVDLGGIFSFLVAELLLGPWKELKDSLVVTAYWTLDYFSDLIFWSLQLLSSMPGSSSHDEGTFDLDASTSTSNINKLSLNTSAMTPSSSDQMDVTLVSPVSSLSETDNKKWELGSSTTSTSTSTISSPSSPSSSPRTLKLVISPPDSPIENDNGDPHLDRTDHEHCLQSPFSEELRSSESIDAFHASLLSSVSVSSELVDSSSSFLREDLRIASHSPLNFSLSRGGSGDEYFPSPTSIGGSGIGNFGTGAHSSPPTATSATPPRLPTTTTARQVRRPVSARSLSVGTISHSHEDKENIAPTADNSPSTPPDGSPRTRRLALRRGYSSFRSPR